MYDIFTLAVSNMINKTAECSNDIANSLKSILTKVEHC